MKDLRLFLLDMDGTIYLGSKLFDGTLDFLQYVKDLGGRYMFLTNNSSRGVETYIQRMKNFGIETTAEDFLTSTDATITYLKAQHPDALYYVCGTESMKKQIRDAGFAMTDDPEEKVDVLLLGYDTEITYRKIEDCCILLNRGVTYIATHPDMVCPTNYGSAPDCGSYIVMFETATGRRPSVIIGKPQPQMAYAAMERTGYTPAQTCMIGDRIYTDIASGVNAGISTCFVLSGEGVPSDIEKYNVHPTYTMENIRSFLNALKSVNGDGSV